MKAIKLYKQLEKDFVKPSLTDDWARYMHSISDFLSENFKKRSMGLVCDNSQDINKVYTTVFPSDEVMQLILDKSETDIMLFVHHPSVWVLGKKPKIPHKTNRDIVFREMNKHLLQQFKKRRISIYNLHVPLDNYGEYSTSVTLAKALNMRPEKPFAPYFGGLCGVIAKTDIKTIKNLRKRIEKVINHNVKLYPYGKNEIRNKKVAIIAGGGNFPEEVPNIAELGINTFVTGVTRLNKNYKRSVKAHSLLRKFKINLIGATHYSTEKFACIAMCKYFKKLRLQSEFIEGKPLLTDM